MDETVTTREGIVGVAARYVVEPSDWVDMPEASPRARARVEPGKPAVTVVIDITGKIHTVPGSEIEVDPYADPKYEAVREEGRRRFGQASGLDVDVRRGTATPRAIGRPVGQAVPAPGFEQDTAGARRVPPMPRDPRDETHGAEFEAYDAASEPAPGDEPHGHHPVWHG